MLEAEPLLFDRGQVTFPWVFWLCLGLETPSSTWDSAQDSSLQSSWTEALWVPSGSGWTKRLVSLGVPGVGQ